MPKMKTKSSAKKRFKVTASGKIKAGQAGKRHGMIKRTNKQIRNLRGTRVMSDSESQRIKRNAALGQSQDTGNTPIIQDKKKGWFQSLIPNWF